MYEKTKHACGDDSLSRARVFRWHKMFAEGIETLGDEPRSGRPVSTSLEIGIERVEACIRQDRRLILRMAAEKLSLNDDAVHKVYYMRKVCARFV
jgi:hypothetical protein